jgi:hypothetical protein
VPSRGNPKDDVELSNLMSQATQPFFNRLGIRKSLLPRFSLLAATSVVIYTTGRAAQRAPPLPLAHIGSTVSRDWLIARSIDSTVGNAPVPRAADGAAGAPASLGSGGMDGIRRRTHWSKREF